MADNNNKPRLQLRSHKELFATREEVINYLDREVKFDSNGLFGEPVLLFYGDIDKPNMILAVGSTIEGGSNSYYVIDDAELREMIAQASEDAESGAEASKLLDRVIETIGLDKLTENRIDPEVEYNPENELIRDCETIKEAIETLAEAVEEAHIPDIADVDFNYEPFDDNIIGYIDGHGLLAAVDLSYNEHTNELTFSRSGYNEGGVFKTDAYTNTIALGKHTEYTADNEGNNVEVTIDNETKKISANAKVLEVNTENVNGGTVAPITVTVEEDGDGKGVNITATLNYGDGLSVVNGQLTAGVPKVVKSASYNANTNELVIVFDNGTQEGEAVVIPVSGLIDEFKANNDGHTVTVTVNTAGEDGFTEFSADVNLLNSPNNLIEKNEGAIYVHKANIQEIASDVATAIANDKVQALGDEVEGKLDLKADKSYVDDKLEEKADVAALDAAYAYLNEHKAEKQYVDDAIAAVAASVPTVDDELSNTSTNPVQNKVIYAALADKADTSDISDINNVINGIKIVQDETDAHLYHLMVNGINAGDIVDTDTDTDKFIASAELNDHNELVFKYNDDTVCGSPVSLSALTDIYTAGDGIEIDNNKIGIRLDGHDEFLTLDVLGDGSDTALHTQGIREAINETTDAATDGLVNGVSYADHVITVSQKGVDNPTEIDLNDLVNEAYDLPVATADSLGGVKVGNGIDVASDGTISVNGAYIKQSDVVQSFSDSSLPASNPVSKSAVLDYVENIQEGLNIDTINSEIADLQSGKVDKSVYEAYVASNDTAVASKADAASVDAALNGKVDKSVYDAYVASNDASVALKADKAEVDAALGNKADSADVIDNATLTNNVLYLKNGNTEITNVDLSSLSDVYSAGDGLNLTNNEFSVRLRTGDKYLELEDGELKSKGIDEALALKANAADVTAALNDKADASEMTTALAAKADKSYVDDAIEDINTALEGKADEADVVEALDAKANAADVSTALAEKQDLLTTSNTVSIVTEGGETKANVRVSGTQGNIINALTDGLYVNVSVDVDQATNKLVFTVNGSTNSIDLPGVKVVQSSAYNDVTKTLDIIFADGSSTSIPVAELVDRVSVPALQEGPVVLTLTNVNGGQEMSASLDARKLTADNSVIESNALLYDEPTNSLYVENLKPAVEQNTSAISDHEGRIAQLENTIGQLTDLVQQLQTQVNSYSAAIADYGTRIDELETQVYRRMLDLNDVDGDGQYTSADGLDGF